MVKQTYIFESPFRKHHLANFSIHHFHTSWDTNISSDHLKHVSTIPMNVPWRFARYVTLSLHQIKAGSTTFSCMCVEKKHTGPGAHTHCVSDTQTLTSCWNPDTGTLGPWWLSTERQASTRCRTPMSSPMRRRSTPSSVVRGEASKRDLSTVKGRVGRELAMGDVRM